jgi:hypothetical protein
MRISADDLYKMNDAMKAEVGWNMVLPETLGSCGVEKGIQILKALKRLQLGLMSLASGNFVPLKRRSN